jgi:hypothetical protein
MPLNLLLSQKVDISIFIRGISHQPLSLVDKSHRCLHHLLLRAHMVGLFQSHVDFALSLAFFLKTHANL